MLLLGMLQTSLIHSQVINYDQDGRKTHPVSERTIIIVHKVTDEKTRGIIGNISLPGLIGAIIPIAVNVTKQILSALEEKYTASYVASIYETGLIYDSAHSGSSSFLNIESIDLVRIAENLDFNKDTVTKITLVPVIEPNGGFFGFKVKSLSLPFTKAKRTRRGRRGKTLDVNITIKVEAQWKEPTGNEKSSDSAKGQTNFQVKAATLGESSIFIPAIFPTDNTYLGQTYRSGWFQLPPATALHFAGKENHYAVVFYTLTITVKEANPYGVTAKKMAAFFSAESSDIISILKQVVPAPAK